MSAVETLIDLDGVGLEVTTPLRTRILHPITLSIRRHSSVALVGPSGAGKTTLASIIGALQRPTEGSYRFAGSRVDGTDAVRLARFRRNHIGFVFQNAHLIDERSALDNVRLGVVDPRIAPRQSAVDARAALASVGLDGLASRPAALLSGGERQRVALARAIVKRPDLVIADEPTGALDRASGRAVLDLLFSLDTTVLLVTHDPDVASRAVTTVTIVDGALQ
ncbi:MAG: ABC transporter ATP-binding protein [Micropruina sp.]|uniref:ABC transporter ATP-binding protein n=1 Tax=Micropruina sp. TaxID=2737536 RepID=UPI0039E46BB9